MGTIVRRYARLTYAVAALALLAVALLPTFAGKAFAYGQVTTRSIKMSSATAGATSVSYLVSFTPATTGNVQAIIVDFCDNSPLVADTTCTAPTSFSISASPAVSGQSSGANCNLSTFTTAGQLNSNRTLELSAASAVSINSSGTCSFTLTTVTNPNVAANHTFYGRIYTYDTKAHADSYAVGGSTGIVDAGGVALSTSAVISITVKVQEQLTFCTSAAAISSSPICSGTTAPNIAIGHDNGSGTIILDASAVDATLAYTQVSTNAGSGVIVRMKSSNACGSSSNNGGLSSDGGTTCPIAGVNAGNGTAAVIAAGAPSGNPGGAFGLCVNKGANTTVAASYNDTINNCPTTGANPWNATSKYGMDGTTSTGTASTYGSQLYSTAGAVNAENDTLVFAATASNVTPAGIYTVNESLIATGTF